MTRWLAIGGLVTAVLLWLLWRETRSTSARPALPAAARSSLASATAAALTAPAVTAEPAAAPLAPADGKPAKLDPRSDEFFYQFDEAVPKALTRNAARCYEGRQGSLHRNQKLILRFRTRIVDGEVQVRDVAVKESTLGDAALETCFLQEVQRTTWRNDQLPDWEQDDELVIRPERGMKKYSRRNMDYVGAEAPRE
jgi:hypothetical protein